MISSLMAITEHTLLLEYRILGFTIGKLFLCVVQMGEWVIAKADNLVPPA